MQLAPGPQFPMEEDWSNLYVDVVRTETRAAGCLALTTGVARPEGPRLDPLPKEEAPVQLSTLCRHSRRGGNRIEGEIHG